MITPITPAQDERLNWLIEECAEVIQEAIKIKRFGFDSFHPDDPAKETNRDRLHREMTDVMGCFALLVRDGDVEDSLPSEAARAAQKKLKRARFQLSEVEDARSA
jgi:NTP pyrophosphatase (non-canonical NTP hydrolase)